MYSCDRVRPRRSARNVTENFRFLLEGKPHPLLIPSIINEVTTYLSLKELKVFRLVCTTWNDEAHKKINKIAKIVMPNLSVLCDFISEMKNSPRYYSSFEFRGDFDMGSDIVRDFYTSFGNQVKFLYVNRIRWTESELREILFDKLTNLEELGLEARAYSDRRLFTGEEIQRLPKIRALNLNIFSFITELTTPFLRDILRASPNVETISSLRTEKRNPLPMQFIQYVCQEMSYDTADDVVNMPFASDIAIAEAIIETSDLKLERLNSLHCNLRLRGPGMIELAKKKLKLNHLDLTALADVTTEILHKLLISMEGSLRKLKLKFHPRCNSNDQIPVPPMAHLTHLDLNGYKGSLKFLENIPNLHTLILHRIEFPRALGMEPLELKSESRLKTLEVHEEFSQFCPTETLNNLVQLFPKLTRLKMENVTDSGLRVLFEHLPKLQELDLMNGCYTDSGITGFSPQICRAMAVSDSYYYEIDEEKRVFPSIAALNDLQSLSLASPYITDNSILYGVLYCKGLRKISLMAYGITDVSLTSLVDNLDLFYVQTQYCNRLTLRGEKYAMEKMKGREIHINEYKGPLKQSEIPKFMRRNGHVFVKMNKLED